MLCSFLLSADIDSQLITILTMTAVSIICGTIFFVVGYVKKIKLMVAASVLFLSSLITYWFDPISGIAANVCVILAYLVGSKCNFEKKDKEPVVEDSPIVDKSLPFDINNYIGRKEDTDTVSKNIDSDKSNKWYVFRFILMLLSLFALVAVAYAIVCFFNYLFQIKL